jgi:hypothetical protein
MPYDMFAPCSGLPETNAVPLLSFPTIPTIYSLYRETMMFLYLPRFCGRGSSPFCPGTLRHRKSQNHYSCHTHIGKHLNGDMRYPVPNSGIEPNTSHQCCHGRFRCTYDYMDCSQTKKTIIGFSGSSDILYR